MLQKLNYSISFLFLMNFLNFTFLFLELFLDESTMVLQYLIMMFIMVTPTHFKKWKVSKASQCMFVHVNCFCNGMSVLQILLAPKRGD